MNKEKSILKKIINPHDKIVVACSGGPDSMALLHMLTFERKEIDFELICVHINHNKRLASEDEKILVENFCKENKAIFEYTKFETYEAGNFQEVARLKRYQFFEQILKKHHAHKLLTAHHADDLMETILMRLLRGSTLKGYTGFSFETDAGWYQIYRPLINYEKDELLNYVIENKVPYAIDDSNNEDFYTRNRIRHHIIPLLKEENKKATSKFLNFSQRLNEAANFIEELTKTEIAKLYEDKTLDLVKFGYEDSFLQKEILKSILSDFYGNDVPRLKENHIELILEAIKSYRPNAEVVLPLNVRVLKRYNQLIFTRFKEETPNYQVLFDDKLELYNFKIEAIAASETDGNDICRLNIDDVYLPLYVRNRLPGDRIEVKGLNGTKKIKDIFIEKKIPEEKRAFWPIIVDAHNKVLWLPGLKKSKYNKSKHEKCDIILKYYQKEEKN